MGLLADLIFVHTLAVTHHTVMLELALLEAGQWISNQASKQPGIRVAQLGLSAAGRSAALDQVIRALSRPVGSSNSSQRQKYVGFGCRVLPGLPATNAIFIFPNGFVARLRPFGRGVRACLVGVPNLTPGWECPVVAWLLSTGQKAQNSHATQNIHATQNSHAMQNIHATRHGPGHKRKNRRQGKMCRWRNRLNTRKKKKQNRKARMKAMKAITTPNQTPLWM